ncbi:prepilin-type N-terminal cleavage/methylation domain-containing protein [Candidatus Falkowbacteria bacterium]|nr:prepilin-type N-terminal cleavage/methylation domain-containing protein [Candidatus Falkowbacteria bacterium]
MFSGQKNQKSQRGFTLIELIVSISVIAMMSGLFLANYHSANKRSELASAAQKTASDIRLAQQFSLGANEFNGAPPAGGWGIYFDESSPDSYIIFADIDENRNYDSGEEHARVNLPVGVSIEEIEDSDTGIIITNASVVFLPPDPITYINNSSGNNVSITLKDVNNSVKTVEVNFLGLVEVVD